MSKSTGDKTRLFLCPWQSYQPVPQDFYHSTAFGEYDIVNSDGLLLKHLRSGAFGIKLINGALIPGSTTAANILDTY